MKFFNMFISSIALFLIGYYIGSTYQKEASSSIKAEQSPAIMINKDQNNKTKEITLKKSINQEHQVTFKVKIINASMERDYVDEKLIEIKEMFTSFTQLSEFKLLKEETFKVKVGNTHKIVLPNNNIIYFSPRDINLNQSLALNIRIPWVLNINLHAKSKEGFFQGGLKNGDDFIILYIEPVF